MYIGRPDNNGFRQVRLRLRGRKSVDISPGYRINDSLKGYKPHTKSEIDMYKRLISGKSY